MVLFGLVGLIHPVHGIQLELFAKMVPSAAIAFCKHYEYFPVSAPYSNENGTAMAIYQPLVTFFQLID